MSKNESTAINSSMSMIEWSMLLSLSVLWGGSFFFVGVMVEDLPPFTIVASRVALAALALHLFLLVQGQRIPRSLNLWGAFFMMGLLNNVVPFSLIVWGQTHIASGLASILNATTPIFTVLVAHVLTQDERLSMGRLAGVTAGFAGVAVMMGAEVFDGLGTSFFAQGAVLTAALSYAFAGVFGRRFKKMGVKPLHTATGQVTASAVMLLPLSMWVDEPWTLAMPGEWTWAAMVGLGLLSTALAYTLYFRILATAGATNVLLVTLLVPVSAILLGVLVLGEVLEPNSIAGMTLIALGLALIDGRVWRAIRAAVLRRESHDQ